VPKKIPSGIDRFELYEASVQEADLEVKSIARVARKELGREALKLREDFCGTFWLGQEWTRRSPKHKAVGVDLDRPTIEWGLRRHAALHDGRRIQTHVQDVCKMKSGNFDLIIALNFSYFIFHERAQILEYFKAAYKSLARNSLFLLDHFGGPNLFERRPESRTIKLSNGAKFRYVWEQTMFDSNTARARYAIHFEFPRGKKNMREAFVYDWRLWTLPELQDLLREAGFERVSIYLEDDNGHYRKSSQGEKGCPQWLAYLAAVKT
jgi:SAM-dependent methyltransferase